MLGLLHRLDATLVALVGLAIATVSTPRFVPGALLGDAVLLALAALKGRKILLDYLDLRAAPAVWRGLVKHGFFSSRLSPGPLRPLPC